MAKILSGAEMRELGTAIDGVLEDRECCFALFVFPFGEAGQANYISTGNREDMLKVLKETYFKLSNGQVIDTPEHN